jgi:hypothetical protein
MPAQVGNLIWQVLGRSHLTTSPRGSVTFITTSLSLSLLQSVHAVLLSNVLHTLCITLNLNSKRHNECPNKNS